MLKRKSDAHHPDAWITHVAKIRGEKDGLLLKKAVRLYDTTLMQPLLEKGIAISSVLLALGLDTETLSAGIVYPALQENEIHLDTIIDCLGESSSQLLRDVLQMQSLGKLQHIKKSGKHQLENLRKMLLAMVTDVRAVLIILTERLWQLHQAKKMSKPEQQKLAQETLEVYAPLANRLGVWQLKWEIEDLCFRYLQPDVYRKIAKWLISKRDERETYIQRMIEIVNHVLKNTGLSRFQVTGRVKHIYSIYCKSIRKGYGLDEIHDISALRILVPEISDCYSVLSVLQNTWESIAGEFDDYITRPKPNGYRSIHTVMRGPENHIIEVQIRTDQMHQESELGMAAHWRYKEGILVTSNYEAKIALLREIMAWQKEVAASDNVKTEQVVQDLFADRVYVFTPTGDIMDLPKGATPLDFAYQVHSEVGHRCRGAKVDGNMVTLTYLLQTGQHVEILTAKQASPSRDWLNIHYGYLKTPRARSKVQHWFRLHQPIITASDERELPETTTPVASAPIKTFKETKREGPPRIQILGVNNLLTKLAQCCKPARGDVIVGYITQTRGVSIHLQSCSNIKHIKESNRPRLIDVEWD